METGKNPDDSQIQNHKEGVKGAFSRAAHIYDRIGPRYFSYFGERLAGLANLTPGMEVLDLATGRGAVLLPAAKLVGPNGRVTGIDIAEGMVRETAQDLAGRGITNAQVLQMDAEQLNFENNSFDAVLCGFGLFFFPRLDKALAEVYRVLKPGGPIAASVYGQTEGQVNRLKWLKRAMFGRAKFELLSRRVLYQARRLKSANLVHQK